VYAVYAIVRNLISFYYYGFVHAGCFRHFVDLFRYFCSKY
jgi:hypothetical protein